MKKLLLAAALLFPVAAHADFVGKPMVMDGDTVSFGDQRVNLFGVHAPTITQTCGESGAIWSCGWDAVLYLEEQIGERDVVCAVVDGVAAEEPVARCTVEGIDLAGLMIDAGLAVRDETHGGDYAEREAAAVAEGRGIWSGPFIDPVVWAERGGCSCSARKKSVLETAKLLKEQDEDLSE